MQLNQLLILAGVLGAAAHPSGHAHLHRSAAARRDVHYKNIHSAPPPPPPAPTSTKVAPSPSPTSQDIAGPGKSKITDTDTDTETDEYIPFCSGWTGSSSSKAKRVTYDQIMYTGNLGTSGGCKWNSNMMLVPNSIADKYDYVQTYTNVADEPYQVICANKMGADGRLTGLFKVPGQDPLIFTLEPGETKTVVAEANTQGACAFAPHKVPLTENDQYAGTWAEFDFASEPNKGWSGADCSALVAQNSENDMEVYGCRMSHGGIDSIIYPGGEADNAYIKGMEALDGIGLNIEPGKCLIEVLVGFAKSTV
ncbi:hypothetical protein VTH82DRAFT_3277 [Thermothelomyces myriococcoides]